MCAKMSGPEPAGSWIRRAGFGRERSPSSADGVWNSYACAPACRRHRGLVCGMTCAHWEWIRKLLFETKVGSHWFAHVGSNSRFPERRRGLGTRSAPEPLWRCACQFHNLAREELGFSGSWSEHRSDGGKLEQRWIGDTASLWVPFLAAEKGTPPEPLG